MVEDVIGPERMVPCEQEFEHAPPHGREFQALSFALRFRSRDALRDAMAVIVLFEPFGVHAGAFSLSGVQIWGCYNITLPVTTLSMMLHYHSRVAGAAFALTCLPATLSADAPRVVADIAPIHALVAQVMDGVGTPDVLIPQGASPHGFSLRPSQARALSDADLVVTMGENLSSWLPEAMRSLAPDVQYLDLLDAPGATLLAFRESVLFDDAGQAHKDHEHDADADDGHDGHDHAEHDLAHDAAHAHEDKHDHNHDDDHGHAEHAQEEHGHDDAHGDEKAHDHGDDHGHDHAHDHSGVDPHAWLDPDNAALWLGVIAAQLSAQDPANAATYAANAAAAQQELAALDIELQSQLAPVQDVAFVVFHDAYHYFEDHYGLSSAGALRLSDAASPGARSVAMLKDRVAAGDVACVFSEPQFDADLVGVVADRTGLRVSVLDPLGAHLEPGAGFYAALMRDMAGQISDCLSGPS